MSRYSAFDADWSPARNSGRGKGSKLRVAWQPDPFGEGIAAPVMAAMERAREALLAAGHIVEEVCLPDARLASEVWGRITLAEFESLQRAALERDGSDGVIQVVNGYKDFFGWSTPWGCPPPPCPPGSTMAYRWACS